MVNLRLVTPSEQPTVEPPIPNPSSTAIGYCLRVHGEEVSVLDELRRRRIAVGRIVGVARGNPATYDVQPVDGGRRICGITGDRLVSLERV